MTKLLASLKATKVLLKLISVLAAYAAVLEFTAKQKSRLNCSFAYFIVNLILTSFYFSLTKAEEDGRFLACKGNSCCAVSVCFFLAENLININIYIVERMRTRSLHTGHSTTFSPCWKLFKNVIWGKNCLRNFLKCVILDVIVYEPLLSQISWTTLATSLENQWSWSDLFWI